MEYEDLITLADRLSSFLGRSEATLSNRIVGHARFFKRLRDGKGCNVSTFKRVIGWFSDNWPDDLAWPSDIPRPKPNKKEAA